MNGNETQPLKSKNVAWVLGIVLIVVLAALGVIFVLLRDRPSSSSNGTNGAANQASRNANESGAVSNGNTNAFVDAEVFYRNPQFGYAVRYVDPGRDRSTATTSNTSEDLYSEWTIESGEGSIIAIQVFPKEKRTAIFSARSYATTDEVVTLGSVDANILTLNGAKRGYALEYGSYLFVLLAGGEPGTAAYTEFDTIAKTFVF